ncbi:High affinity Ca2+/Mn2+ P-type ATPase-like protein [Rhizina undulata]
MDSPTNAPMGIPMRNISTPYTPSPSASSLSTVYCTLTPEETASKLQTSLTHGLPSAQEAQLRQSIHGLNELPSGDDESVYVRFFKQFLESPLILLLLGSAVLSFFMGNLEDAISITLAVLIVVSVGFVQEYRSEKSLEALNKLVPHHAHLLRGRTSESDDSVGGTPKSTLVMAGQLVPGDLVTFATGDRIPADIRITLSAELEIDESNLTGETDAVRKSAQAVVPMDAPNPTLSEISISDRTCIAFMGTLVRHGHGQGLVIATGAKTEFGVISAMLSNISKPKTPLQSSMDKLGKDLSYASFCVIGLIMLVGLWQGRSWLAMLQIGVSLAVAAIPEGLPIIVTVTLALGVLRMSGKGGIVRRLPSVETLGCVSVVCSDKTGTLTMNHMTVSKVWTPTHASPVEKETLLKRDAPPDAAVRAIIRTGNFCNNARHSSSGPSAASGLGDSSANSKFVGQPTDVALLDLMDAFEGDDLRERHHRILETPFSSKRKWMGVVVGGGSSGEGATGTAYIKGAMERVLERCDKYLTKDGRELPLDDAQRKRSFEAAESMAEEGLRVLGFASGASSGSGPSLRASGSSTPTSSNGEDDPVFSGLTFVGAVGMFDPPRKGVKSAIKRLMQGGVKVIMITGDAETTAVAIARKLGMPMIPNVRANGSTSARPVLKGDDLDAMTEAQLAQAISSTTIFARTSPEHKMKIIRALQSRGDVVAMTGDGVNDAPALKMADIGICMGVQGTDVAKEAADMILSNDDFTTILGAIEEGKGIFYNIQNFLTFQLSTSVAALSLVLLSTFCGLKNPLNPMQILWINILMDGPPAQSLGVEPVDPAVMSRPPRSRSAQILTPSVLKRILLSATIIVIGTMIIYVREMASDGTVTARDTTMTFTCFVLFDMFNALACRSEGKSLLLGEIDLLGNKMFNFAVAASLLGQLAVIYIPFLQSVFQTEALSLHDLVALVLLTSSVFFVDEGRKLFKRRRELGGGYSRNV